MIKPIETVYNGIRFRSRTEARWAVFMDAAGISYQYELEGYDLPSSWYLPDFWVPLFDAFFEIKGDSITPEEIKKAKELSIKSQKDVYIFSGQPRQDGYKGHLYSGGDLVCENIHICSCRRCAEFWVIGKDVNGNTFFASSTGLPDGHACSETKFDERGLALAFVAAMSKRFEHDERECIQ